MSNINLGTATQTLDIGRKLDAYTGVIIHAGQDADGNDIEYSAGTNTGYVLEVDNPIGTQQMAYTILSGLKLRGSRYQPFEAGTAQLDPAAEIGDGITVNGKSSTILSLDKAHSQMMAATVSAPFDEEVDHEFKYEPRTTREFKRESSYARSRISQNENEIALEVARATGAEGELSSRITVTADAITSEVARATTAEGTLSSRVTQTANAITSEVTRATAAEGNLGTRIDQRLDGITLSVTSASGSSTFAIKDGSTTLDSESLDLTVKSVNISGTLTVGTQVPSNLALYDNSTSGYQNASQVTTITNDTISTTNVLAQNLQVNSANINGLLSASQLAVGNDSNLYPDYDSFEQITNDTLYYAKSAELTATVVATDYARDGRKVMRLATGDTISNAYIFIGHSTTGYAQVRCPAGKYIFSYYGRNTSGSVQVKTTVYGRASKGSSWSDSSTYTGLATNTTTFGGAYARVEMPITVTSDKPFVCVRFQVMTASTAVLIDCLQLEKRANDNQTAGAWHPAGTATINGGNITANTITATQIDATNLHVQAANIDGTLTASQINVTDLSAFGATIAGWTINSTSLSKVRANTYGVYLYAPDTPSGDDYCFYTRLYDTSTSAWKTNFYVKYNGNVFCTGVLVAKANSDIGGVSVNSSGTLSGIGTTNCDTGINTNLGYAAGYGGAIVSGANGPTYFNAYSIRARGTLTQAGYGFARNTVTVKGSDGTTNVTLNYYSWST